MDGWGRVAGRCGLAEDWLGWARLGGAGLAWVRFGG